MSELQRWKDFVNEQIALEGVWHQKMVPGYLAPYPGAMINVPDSRAGVGGGGSAPIWSFQAALQRKVQGLAGTFAYRSMPDDQVRELLQEVADDSQAYLGDLDPDLANSKALVEEYVQLFRFAVTPI